MRLHLLMVKLHGLIVTAMLYKKPIYECEYFTLSVEEIIGKVFVHLDVYKWTPRAKRLYDEISMEAFKLLGKEVYMLFRDDGTNKYCILRKFAVNYGFRLCRFDMLFDQLNIKIPTFPEGYTLYCREQM
jgi:hypothetical protein